MSIIEKVKENDFIRQLGKRINIHKEFSKEEKNFSQNYMECLSTQKAYEYKMLLLVHSLEKGMTMATRSFGEKKALELVALIERYISNQYDTGVTAFLLSVSIIHQWAEFLRERGWNSAIVSDIEKRASAFSGVVDIKTGIVKLTEEELLPPKQMDFAHFAETRRAVRNYSSEALRNDDILECVRIALLAPTACNRQMVRIYRIVDEEKKQYMLKHIIGISGFDNENVNIFVLGYDIASLNYYGERNQGYFNAGLVGMTFANALHSKGIGNCFLQWSNTLNETAQVQKKIGISEDVCIAGILAAGYYAEESIIPVSARKRTSEVYAEL